MLTTTDDQTDQEHLMKRDYSPLTEVLDTNEDESGSDTVTRELEQFKAEIDKILHESPKVQNYERKLPKIGSWN